MISEATVRTADFEKLESGLKDLKEDWSEVVAHPDYEINVAFNVLERQVERVIEDCGYSFSDEKSETRCTLGNRDTGLEVFYCNPGVLVIISYAFETVVFSNGDKDTEMRLKDIKVVSV